MNWSYFFLTNDSTGQTNGLRPAADGGNRPQSEDKPAHGARTGRAVQAAGAHRQQGPEDAFAEPSADLAPRNSWRVQPGARAGGYFDYRDYFRARRSAGAHRMQHG